MVDGASVPFALGDFPIYFERKHSLSKTVGLLASGDNNEKKKSKMYIRSRKIKGRCLLGHSIVVADTLSSNSLMSEPRGPNNARIADVRT